MLRQILHQFFWDTYDHLGRLIAFNFLLLVLTVPFIYASAGLIGLAAAAPSVPTLALVFLLLFLVLLPLHSVLWWAPLMHFAHLVSLEKDPSLREFAYGLRRFAKTILRFAVPFWLVTGVLAFNVWFYYLSGAFTGSLRVLGLFLGGFCFWLLVMHIFFGLVALPRVVRDRIGYRSAIKQGFFTTLLYPGTAIAFTLFLLSFLILGAVIRFAGLVIYGFFLPGMMANSFLDVVNERLEHAEKATESDEEKPTSWKQIRRQEDQDEEQRLVKARYQRTFRDILKPWED